MTARPARRAPRLEPGQRLAPYITRRGRFRKVDPSKGRELPDMSSVVAFAGWAALLVVSYQRALRARREAEDHP